MVTMHMPLLNESTDVWRPVEVTPVYGGVYRVEGPRPAGEEWKFAPGTVVNCKWKLFENEKRLVPTGPAFPPVWHTIARLMLVGLICGVAAWGVQFLPFAYQPSLPLYAVAWLALSGGAYAFLRSRKRFLSSVARALLVIFAGVFVVSLFMRN